MSKRRQGNRQVLSWLQEQWRNQRKAREERELKAEERAAKAYVERAARGEEDRWLDVFGG